MKIHSDKYVEAVAQEQAKARKNGAASGFGDVLSEEVARNGQTATSGVSGSLPGLEAVNPMLQVEQVSSVGAGSTEEAVIAAVEDALSGLDSYSAGLGSSEVSLKSAYRELEAVSGRMEQLKEEYPDLSEDNPALQSLVDEVSVLTETEKIKFNRGDYL